MGAPKSDSALNSSDTSSSKGMEDGHLSKPPKVNDQRAKSRSFKSNARKSLVEKHPESDLQQITEDTGDLPKRVQSNNDYQRNNQLKEML